MNGLFARVGSDLRPGMGHGKPGNSWKTWKVMETWKVVEFWNFFFMPGKSWNFNYMVMESHKNGYNENLVVKNRTYSLKLTYTCIFARVFTNLSFLRRRKLNLNHNAGKIAWK